MVTIIIDPGHGGTVKLRGSSPNNATGQNGTLEKMLTLKIGILTAEILRNLNYNVLLTRSDDTNVGLVDRARFAAANNANVFVSIHFNGYNDHNVQGTEVWVHDNASIHSRKLASSLLKHLVRTTGYTNRGVKTSKFAVLNPNFHLAITAACLVEISFITDPLDENRLQDNNYIIQLAKALSEGIVEYL